MAGSSPSIPRKRSPCRGVVAVWTGQDVLDISPVDYRDPAPEPLLAYRQPVLARERVRYVGEPVAAVFAVDAYIAEDAADLVTLEIDPLPVLTSASAQPAAFDETRSTEATVLRHSFGNIDRAFAEAHTIVELDLDSRPAFGGADGNPRGDRHLRCRPRYAAPAWRRQDPPSQSCDAVRGCWAAIRIPLHLHELHVGGGFGVRGELYPEDILVLVAAMRLRRPVKWIEDRRGASDGDQPFAPAASPRAASRSMRRAQILGIDDQIFHDQGAYIRTHGINVAGFTLASVPGPYRVPSYRGVAHFRLTNKTPAATYRAPGAYEATFVRERLLDVAAQEARDRPG